MKRIANFEYNDSASSEGVCFDMDKVSVCDESEEAHLVRLRESFSSGTIYIEIVLETEPLSNAIAFGVANADLPTVSNLEKSHAFWGYSCSSNEGYNYRISPAKDKNNGKDYNKEGVKIKDKLGMKLEFSSNGTTVTFYVNQVK